MVSLNCFKNRKKTKQRSHNNKNASAKNSSEDRGSSPTISSASSPDTRGMKTLSSTASKDTGYSTSLSGISSSRNNNSSDYHYDDSSIPTIDSDYNQLNSNFSLSDAGGTIGSRSLANFSHATSAFGGDHTIGNTVAGGGDSIERRMYSDVYMSAVVNNHQGGYASSSAHHLSHLIQPPSTSRGNGNSRIYEAQESTFTIDAPKGKLGVVIDTPYHAGKTMPIVHAVKDSSPIANQIQVGDKLIAVDDEDVTSLTAIQVSKLLARKSEQGVRRLRIVRTMRGRESIY